MRGFKLTYFDFDGGRAEPARLALKLGGLRFEDVRIPIPEWDQYKDAIGDQLELIMDGGIRRGTHIIKALAQGADACSIGRPYLYGLAAGGQKGVERALSLLKAEVERDMALLGVSSISEIQGHHLIDRR
ncbi:alpha-hydroxy-acid oxidizing protein [Porticoccaceae bacterium]|nr:alpha-hydroxy-acid oxidizing protein [Porticoccaceae bacterium]